MESSKDLSLNTIMHSHLNEYTKIWAQMVKVMFSTLTNVSNILKISNISKATGSIVTKIHIEPPEIEGTKLCSNSLAHMTTWQ